jgi:Uncharacterised nucleotidyltransferase
MSFVESSPVATASQRSARAHVKPPEFALLLTCCAIASRRWSGGELSRLLEGGVDWARVLELGEHHGVLPQVYQALRETAASVPPEILDELASRYDQNVRRNLRFTAELFRVLDGLEATGISAIPHKGPVLTQFLYGDLALRDFSDLDVFVSREDVLRAKEALRGLGYTPASQFSAAQERAYLASGYEYTFDGPAGRNLLEIQWDIVPRFYAVEFPMQELFARAVQVELGGRRVKCLAPEDLVLTLCVHAAKHAWSRLGWVRDIAATMTSLSLDWKVVLNRAAEFGILRIVGVSLVLAHQLLGANLPEPPCIDLNELENVRWIASLCSGITAHIPAAEEFRTESLEYFRLMLRLRERTGDKVRFATRLLFTPSVGEWEVVNLPAPLFPLYRVVRLFRLAARPFRGHSSPSP